MTGRIFIDSFVQGLYDARSPSGKQGITFEDSDQFGPSKLNARTGDVEPIPDKHWFWGLYQAWRDAGRPTNGVLSTPIGDLKRAVWAPVASARLADERSARAAPNSTNEKG